MELQDKTALPKILQKRRNDFGKKGQSKHTHLTDVDTTNFDPKTKAN
jgi:microfibrillar-associated protein 1